MGKDDIEKTISQENVMNILNFCYEKCLYGIPKVSLNVEDMANEYLHRHKTKELACEAMFKNQIIKCTTSGFLTGFGGAITMPVTLPLNIINVLYVQMRMIACVAYMAGFDIYSDETQTFIYACLAGVSVNQVIKQASIKLGAKFTSRLIKKIPGNVLIKINKAVGFRFITKSGRTGIINLAKGLPLTGALISGGVDFLETKIIAHRSYKWFFNCDFSLNKKNEEDIEIFESDLEENTLI